MILRVQVCMVDSCKKYKRQHKLKQSIETNTNKWNFWNLANPKKWDECSTFKFCHTFEVEYY